MKRTILFLVCICFCITLSAKLVFKCTRVNDEEKTCYITKYGTDYTGEIVIPETVELTNKEGVYTIIGVESFQSCTKITRVTLPSTVKEICNSAFRDCTDLLKIDIPNGLETIGEYAFSHSGLEEIIIPNSVTEIRRWAFYQCLDLKSVYIGDGIQVLDNVEFVGCRSLDKFVIGNGLTKITSTCFVGGTVWYAPSVLVILSDKLESCSFKGAQAIYVSNPEQYAEAMPTYSDLFKPIAKIAIAPTKYTGLRPELKLDTDVELEMAILEKALPTDVGTHSDSIQVTLSYNEWEGEIKLPCTYSIEKTPLTIIPNNSSIYYGEDIPEFTYTGVGFVNNETKDVLDRQPTLMTTATTQSDAGTYHIIALDALSKNYEINYERGVLTVLKAPQTITWEPDFSDARVGELIELSAVSSSGLNVKFKSLDLSTAIITTNNGKSYVYPIKEGTVVLAAYQEGDKNHESADEVYNVLTISSPNSIKEFKNNNKNTIYDINGKQADKRHQGIKVIKSNSGKYKKVI